MDTQKPEIVCKAQLILYTTIVIGIIKPFLEFSALSQQAIHAGKTLLPNLPPQKALVGGWGFMFFVITFGYASLGLLIFLIGKRKNWARFLFLIMFILGIPFAISPLIKSLTSEPFSGVLSLVQIAAQTVGLIFLFQKPAREWFQAQTPLSCPSSVALMTSANNGPETIAMPTPTSGSQDRPSSTNQSSGTSSCPQIRPWVRYWARSIDVLFIANMVLSALIVSGIGLHDDELKLLLYSLLLMPLLGIPLEAFFISQTATTPGKWILKTKVIKTDGTNLSYLESLKRSGLVWMEGMVFTIPIFMQIANIFAYRDLMKKGTTLWDKERYTVAHQKLGAPRVVLAFIALYLLYLFSNFLLQPIG